MIRWCQQQNKSKEGKGGEGAYFRGNFPEIIFLGISFLGRNSQEEIFRESIFSGKIFRNAFFQTPVNSNNDRFPNICIFYFSYQSLTPPIFEYFCEHNIFPHINISGSLKIWGNKKLWAVIFFWTNLKRLKALEQLPLNKASFLNGMSINIMKTRQQILRIFSNTLM